MAIDPSLVVVVNVVLTSATLSQQGFGTPMGVFQVSTAIQPNRTTLYTSVQSMLDAGFAVDDSAVLWATAVKAQSPAPTTFVIGRREPGTAQVDTVDIVTADTGTWVITIDTQAVSYIATALDTELTIAQGLKDQIDLTSIPVVTSDATAATVATFASKTSNEVGPFDLSLGNSVVQPITFLADIDTIANTATINSTSATSTADATPTAVNPTLGFTLTLAINGGNQTYAVTATLAAIGAPTAQDWADDMNPQLLNASVVDDGGGQIQVISDRQGGSASVVFVGGTGTAIAGFTTSTDVAGTADNGIQDTSAVTATELATALQAQWTTGATVTAVGNLDGTVTVSTDLAGVTGSVSPITGTAVTAGAVTWPGGVVFGVDAAGATFTVTAALAGTTFANGGIVPGGGGVATFTNTISNVDAEAMNLALAAIFAFDNSSWYIFTIESRSDADIEAAEFFVRSIKKLFVGQTSDANARDGTTPNIIDTIATLNNIRVTIMWHDDDREYLDGGVAGKLAAADLDAVNGAITLMGKQINGIPTDDLTDAQVINIAGDGENNSGFGGNVHVELASRGFSMFGKTTEGEFIDVLQAIDWTFFRVQTDVLTLIATTPTKVPYTNAGIGAIKNAVLGRLNIGVTNGIFTDDDPLFPRVESPTSAEVSTQDKGTRVLRNVVGFAKLAGAIHKVFIQVNVSV